MKEELEEIENTENKTYSSYYNITHAILTREEIDKVEDGIGYNFISNQFIDEMINFLESKVV